MKKKLVALLAIVLVLFTLSAVACEDVHTHDYVEVAAKNPTCTQKGNSLYYTCTGCSQLFDADKNPIDAIPEIDADHTYVEHTACESKCEQAGNPLYYTCANCTVIFDKDKNVIEKIPEIAALGHDYVNHAEVPANCTEGGNDEYYTCSRCSVIFDKDKKVIEKVPATAALGHDYVNHAEVPANCTEGGNDEYYTCSRCNVIFDASKNVIEAIPTTKAKGHTYVWGDAVGGVSTLKCHCGDVKGSVKVALADSERVFIDVDDVNFDTSAILAKFGEGLTLKSITLGNNTITDLTTIETVIKQLPHGDYNVALEVAIGDSATTVVTLPIRLAHTISTVDDLKKLYTVTDHEKYSNLTVGGTTDAEGNSIATVDWYVLTADIDGEDNWGDITEYGNSDESWYTSGRYVQGFIGVFDGQGHTIKNFKILGHGFFGHVGRGTIKNVNFDNITLADGDTCLIGKLVDSTIENVKVSNITVLGTPSANSGILGYHQFFSATLKDVDIDLTGVTTATNVFAKENTTADGFDATSFSNVTVKLNSTSGIKLFADTSVFDGIGGVTVSFVPFTVDVPTANTDEFYYTGSAQTYTLATSDWYTISGNVQTEVGIYTVTVSLRDFDGLTWADGTTYDKTFTFEIKEFPTEMVETAAEAFVAKVTALGTPVYPRDIAAIQSVLTDYEGLNDLVKAHDSVVTAKATLDGYKTECDKYTLIATYTGTKILPASGYDKYYFVFHSTTAEVTSFFYQNEGDWTGQSNLTLTAGSYLMIEVPKNHIAHTIYLTGLPETGWTLQVYGEKVTVTPGTVTVALSVGGTVDAEIEGGSLKVLSVTVPKGQQYLEGWGHMTADQLVELAKYSNLYVYVYNPLETDVAFFLQDEKDWNGHCRTTLKAQSWTKVALDLSTIPAGYGVYVDVEYKPEANSTGWMISDFYGIAE